jgi:peroxidase
MQIRKRVWIFYVFLLTFQPATAEWPYERYSGTPDKTGHYHPTHAQAEPNDNYFNDWVFHVSQSKYNDIQLLFKNTSVPRGGGLENLLDHLAVPKPPSENVTSRFPAHIPRQWPDIEAKSLLGHLPFSLDPGCIGDKSKWHGCPVVVEAEPSLTKDSRWYRTYDGSCNWLEVGEAQLGAYGHAKSRDYDQHFYADGISSPREGPNPRAVSNAFFKRKDTLYFEHTPLLLGLVEFIMHDVTWSQDSENDFIDVPMPDDEAFYHRNTTLRVYRTEERPGTGTSRDNPRENLNRATTWLDLSALYGSTREVAMALRGFKGGQLLAQEIQTRGATKKASYLPFNTMGVPTRAPPMMDERTLFAGGDPRTNEDWIMLSVHNLLLREHNRLCGVLSEKKPELGDEDLYQTVRLLMGAKFSLIGNAYQMAYFRDMPWPNDDGMDSSRYLFWMGLTCKALHSIAN